MKPHWITFIGICALSACASKPKPASKATGQSTLIGTVEMVNPEQNYVLIRCDQVLAINAGTEIIALRADGRKAKLVLTPERKGYYLTADIKEGQPAVSDLVLILSGSQPAAAASSSPPATPPATPSTSGGYTMPVLPQIPLSLPEAAPKTTAPEPTIDLNDLEPPVQ